MAYLHCERCGLQITIQAPFMRIENCPRCLARTATVRR
jgi:Zn finger protein HypA/HybF involved in hydrogenase expression